MGCNPVSDVNDALVKWPEMGGNNMTLLKTRSVHVPAWVIFLGLVFCGAALAQTGLPPQPPRLPPVPAVTSPRLYVIDCGTIVSNQPERFGVTREDVFNLNFSDPCFLVMHPKGSLLFDTGLNDRNVGRPLYETMMGYEAQVKFTTLRGELANMGLRPEMIT